MKIQDSQIETLPASASKLQAVAQELLSLVEQRYAQPLTDSRTLPAWAA
jgi:hypothetical protein